MSESLGATVGKLIADLQFALAVFVVDDGRIRGRPFLFEGVLFLPGPVLQILYSGIMLLDLP